LTKRARDEVIAVSYHLSTAIFIIRDQGFRLITSTFASKIRRRDAGDFHVTTFPVSSCPITLSSSALPIAAWSS
jgi:hypothetical protein